jgi:ribosomal protein L37E
MTSMIASPLTAADRCDRCGAQAYMRATMVSGAELYFCAHHAREYEAGLRAVEADIQWESERLAEPELESSRES